MSIDAFWVFESFDLYNCTENISIMLKFADDTKLVQGVATQNDITSLQNTAHKLIV